MGFHTGGMCIAKIMRLIILFRILSIFVIAKKSLVAITLIHLNWYLNTVFTLTFIYRFFILLEGA